MFASGKFWMWFWAAVLLFVGAQSVVVGVWFLDSVKAINLMSIEALLLSTGAGFQATLGMRKADPDDSL